MADVDKMTDGSQRGGPAYGALWPASMGPSRARSAGRRLEAQDAQEMSGDPVRQLLEPLRLQVAHAPAGQAVSGDEAGLLEHTQVLRDGGLPHREGRSDVEHPG
jgi:hypothetical protein